MEIFFVRNFVFIFVISIFTLIVKCENNYCNNFKDCNQCTLCNDETKTSCKCQWTNEGCIYNETKDSGEWYSRTKVCQNLEEPPQSIYCPKSMSKKTEDDLGDDNSIQYKIKPDSDGNYGKEMVVCNFEFEQNSHEDINVKIYFFFQVFYYPRVYIESIDSSGTKKEMTIERSDDYKFASNSKIIIRVLLRQEYPISPIDIEINLINKPKNVLLSIFFFILFALAGAFMTVLVYHIIQRCEKKKKIQSENASLNLSNRGIIRKKNISIKQLNKQKLNNLFNDKMKKTFYKDVYNQNGGICTICLNKFDEKSEVSITSCKHIFHYQCIYNWLFKNIKNPKCPNCKHEILKDEDEKDVNNSNEKKETNVITVRRRFRGFNFNNFSNQIDDSNRRALTLNINHQTINDDSSQKYHINGN